MSNEITAPITIVRNVINAPISFGVTGKSAYQSYLDTTDDDPVLTEAEWSTGGGGGAPSEHASNHAADGTDPICYHSDTAPLTADLGQKWLQTTTGREYEYFGGAWVEVASGPALDLSGYLTKIGGITSGVVVGNTTDLETVASIALPVGTWYIKAVWLLTGTANTGTKHGLAFSGTTSLVRLNRARASNWIFTAVTTLPFSLALTESTTQAQLEGWITVTVAGTLSLQAAKNAAHADSLTAGATSFLAASPSAI